jgi:hypothetical protein
MANQGKPMKPLFTDAMLTHSLLLFLLLGSVAGVFAGFALLFKPAWLLGVNKLANHWVSTRQLTRPLTRIIDLDGWIYRYNRSTGVLILSGSIYMLYYFSAVFSPAVALNALTSNYWLPSAMKQGLIDALVLVAMTGSVFALLISLFLILRPSLLRDFETRANQKTSLRQQLKPLEIQRNALEQLVSRNMRLFGVLILAGSLYTLFVLLTNWKQV